jgi:glutamate synthase (NADPH/NADH)
LCLLSSSATLQGDLLAVEEYEDVVQLKSLIQRHLKFTGSETARRILLGWDKERLHFKKVTNACKFLISC